MKHVVLELVLVAFSLGVQQYADDTPAPPKDGGGADKLVGHWTVVRGKNEQKAVEQEKILGSEVKFTKDRIIAYDPKHKELYVATYKVDDSAAPHKITMTVVEGPMKGKKAEGIYKVEGDQLTLTYSVPGDQRPPELNTKGEGHQLMFVLKRAKDAGNAKESKAPDR
ncbi:MAG: TIGR03067 domain-containing protein [Gemmataceae bacterium]|nr:TIGR03067 domain-containing protein [Gemmataceae bacterium]